jgi:hypothetical protein
MGPRLSQHSEFLELRDSTRVRVGAGHCHFGMSAKADPSLVTFLSFAF